MRKLRQHKDSVAVDTERVLKRVRIAPNDIVTFFLD